MNLTVFLLYFKIKSENIENELIDFSKSDLSLDFNVCKYYGVDKYLRCHGMVVLPKYRGRDIVRQFLLSRKAICKANHLELTSSIFTTSYTNQIADDIGYKCNKRLRYKL